MTSVSNIWHYGLTKENPDLATIKCICDFWSKLSVLYVESTVYVQGFLFFAIIYSFSVFAWIVASHHLLDFLTYTFLHCTF